MEEKLRKCLVDYFSFCEEFILTVKVILKDCEKHSINVYNLTERYITIVKADTTYTPLAAFDTIKGRLCCILQKHINDEIKSLETLKCDLNNQTEKLTNKFTNFQNLHKQFDYSEENSLTTGTALWPSLATLFELAYDANNFALDICGQVECSLELIHLKKTNDNLPRNFRIDSDWLNRLNEILALSYYCAKNEQI